MINLSISNKNITNTNLLIPKSNLNPKFWESNSLKSEISDKLLEIASDIIQSMEIKAEVKDIVITGSSASYNWHQFSDIDLHILFDFGQIDKNFELVKRMLDQSRINWNKTHKIMIKNHEVELYFQDIGETHEANGVWSLKNKSWLEKPVKIKPELDLRTAEKKAEMIAKSINHVFDLLEDGENKNAYEYASKIKSKIANMRSAGISEEGIYSPENLAFKMLRNSKYLEKISTIKIKSYDKMMSIQEIYLKDYFNSNKDPEYLKYEGKYDLESLLDPNSDAPWGEVEKDEL